MRHPSEFMMNRLIFPWNLYVHCLLLQLFPSQRGIADSLKYHHYLLSSFVRENWAQQLIKPPCACPTQSDISTHSEQQHWDTTGSKLKAIITCKFEHFDDTVSLSLFPSKDLTYSSNDFIASLYISAQHFLLNLVLLYSLTLTDYVLIHWWLQSWWAACLCSNWLKCLKVVRIWILMCIKGAQMRRFYIYWTSRLAIWRNRSYRDSPETVIQ